MSIKKTPATSFPDFCPPELLSSHSLDLGRQESSSSHHMHWSVLSHSLKQMKHFGCLCTCLHNNAKNTTVFNFFWQREDQDFFLPSFYRTTVYHTISQVRNDFLFFLSHVLKVECRCVRNTRARCRAGTRSIPVCKTHHVEKPTGTTKF